MDKEVIFRASVLPVSFCSSTAFTELGADRAAAERYTAQYTLPAEDNWTLAVTELFVASRLTLRRAGGFSRFAKPADRMRRAVVGDS
jgi:hypothetical protein